MAAFGRGLAALLSCLLWVHAQGTFNLGIYGPFTSISQEYLAVAVLVDIDFRKNTDAAVQARFGPPVIAINNLHADLDLAVTIGTSNSDPNVGIATAVEMLQGAGGVRKVAGLVGGYHSAISMPVNNLATFYEVPQVSWGSTNPGLSDKTTYPYFLRTIPPDSIQGAGMWRFIKHFSIPMVTFMYAKEPYGEGMYGVVSTAASSASESFRINSVGIDYMPTSYDTEHVRSKIQLAMSSLAKVVMVTFTSDQGPHFFPIAKAEGLLGTGYQVVGSEALGPLTSADIPQGYIYFTPESRGTLFPSFENMWKLLTLDDIDSAAANAAYQLDLLKVPLASGVAANLTSSTFDNCDELPLEGPFLFDAAYAFIVAANNMLNNGTAIADVKGEALLNAVRDVSFSGISGDVLFNSDGDRLAAYYVMNLQGSSKTSVQAATYSSAADTITLVSGSSVEWQSGETSNAVIPTSYTQCKAGMYQDTDLLCKSCPVGLITNAAGTGCEECEFGLVALDQASGRICVHDPIQIGVYGPFTSVENRFLAAAVAFDLDFRKNFEPSLVTRFGAPIVTVPNLQTNLRIKLQIATSNSDPPTGVASALSFFTGSDGRDRIVGLVGGYHSAISMPVASLATQYKVPQVSFGSTSPKLSSKAQYPYFVRTIPPDSIQGGGMWRFIKQFLIPSVSFIFAQDSYGEGLFQTVSDLAGQAAEGFRITAVGIPFMPSNYDTALARSICQRVRTLSSKTIFFGMTTDQGRNLFPIAKDEMLLSSQFQSVASEALPGSSAGLSDHVPVGYMWFEPISRGPLFPNFEALWLAMTPEDVTSAANSAYYGLDKMLVNLTDGVTGDITSDTFSDLSTFPLEAPFVFDACYTFVLAANTMMRAQVKPANIGGEAFLDTVRATTFEGISGAVSFNVNGDRLAAYDVLNTQASGVEKAARYDSSTDLITIAAGKSLVWVDGQAGTKIPEALTACRNGFYQDAFLMCQECSAGLVTSADKTSCEACPFGMVPVEDAVNGRRCEYLPVQIGMYGPFTSVSMEFLVTAVAFDLDFRKNHDTALVTRFGPPVIAVPNLRSELRIKLQMGTSDSNPDIGVSTCLELIQGTNGRDPIVGLVGGYHSVISMPVASLATNYKVTQVSFGSTSPKLSNKETYPYFMRTIPPDSIQGGGMWQVVTMFKIPAITFIYAQEPYGEGLFQTVTDLASQNEQAFRVQSVGVRYMPSDYDKDEARNKIRRAMDMSAKVFFIAMTPDQGKPFFSVAAEEGMFGASYQVVGSEALPYSALADAGAPAGYLWLTPVSQGEKFAEFTELWKKMTADDVVGASAQSYYGIDKFKVAVDAGKAAAPTDAMFTGTEGFPLEAPFVFDAAYSFVFAANSLMLKGTEVKDIKGDALHQEVKAVAFEGISGFVKFNEDGDRLASYYIENAKPPSGRRLATGLVTTRPAIYSAATGAITAYGGASAIEILWMSGTVSAEIPLEITACAPGSIPDENGICQKCAPGLFSLGGASRTCQKCAKGTVANLPLGATACNPCSAGSAASEEASTQCTICPKGSFAASDGATECTLCPQGEYQESPGQQSCSRCKANMNTKLMASESRFDCKCEQGFYRDSRNDAEAACVACKEGQTCAFNSDMKHYWEWHAAGRTGQQLPFPTNDFSHMSLGTDPLSVFKCNIAKKCPGGSPGSCAENIDSTVRSCALCKEEYYWTGEKCEKCDFVSTSNILFPALPLLLAPIVICLLYKVSRDESDKWGTWRNGIASFGFLLLNHYQITTLVNNANLQYSGQIIDVLGFFSFTEDPSTIFRPQCSGFQNFQATTVLKSLGPIAIAVMIAITAVGSRVVQMLTKRDVGFEVNRTLNVYFSLMFTFFAGISAMALTMFKCAANPNGIDTLAKDQSVICGSSDWWSMVGVAIVAVILYIFGFGGLFTWAVVVAPRRFADQAFRRRWKFLFIKFRPDVWWWALVICGKGVLMNIGYTFLRLGIAQIYWVMFCIALYTGLLISFLPWRHRISNSLDIFVNKALLLVCSMLAFYVNGAPESLKGIEQEIAWSVTFLNTSPLWVALAMLAKMVWDQKHPAPKMKRVKDLKKLSPSLQQFANAPEGELMEFLNKIDEWGRFYIMSALHVISTEFGGDSHKARLSDGKLKSSSSLDQATKDAAHGPSPMINI